MTERGDRSRPAAFRTSAAFNRSIRAVVRIGVRCGDRRESHPFRLPDDAGAPRQLGLGFGHDLPDIAVHAAGLRKPGSNRADDVAMPVSEKRAREETFRLQPSLRQQRLRNEVAGIRIRIGERVSIALEIIDSRCLTVGRGNQIGLIGVAPAPDGYRDECKLRLISDKRITANPGRIDLARDQLRALFPDRSA